MKVDLLKSEDGDWIGLYIDGRLVDEGHSLSERQILEALGIEHSSYEVDLSTLGRCPYTWQEAERLING